MPDEEDLKRALDEQRRETEELRGAYASALRAGDEIRHQLESERAYSSRLYAIMTTYAASPEELSRVLAQTPTAANGELVKLLWEKAEVNGGGRRICGECGGLLDICDGDRPDAIRCTNAPLRHGKPCFGARARAAIAARLIEDVQSRTGEALSRLVADELLKACEKCGVMLKDHVFATRGDGFHAFVCPSPEIGCTGGPGA